MTSKGLEVVLPSGEGCYYVEVCSAHQQEGYTRGADGCNTCHSYWRRKADDDKKDPGGRGRRLTGVTTITKVLDLDPKHLLRWAARTNGIGIARLAGPVVRTLANGEGSPAMAEEILWLCDHEAIWRELTEHEMTYDDVRDAKAVVGTNIHEQVFQVLGSGQPMFALTGLTDQEKGYARGVMSFFLDHDPQASHVEQIVVSNELGVAGRLDFLGTLDRTCDDPLCPCQDYAPGRLPGVVDAKTGYVGEAAHAQVQGYRGMAQRGGLAPEVGWGAILRLFEDGTYQLVRGQGEPDDFELATRMYRRIGAIGSADEKERKARRAAAK